MNEFCQNTNESTKTENTSSHVLDNEEKENSEDRKSKDQ